MLFLILFLVEVVECGCRKTLGWTLLHPRSNLCCAGALLFYDYSPWQETYRIDAAFNENIYFFF